MIMNLIVIMIVILIMILITNAPNRHLPKELMKMINNQ